MFGEIGFFTGAPRTITIKSRGFSEVMYLDQLEFLNHIYSKHRQAASNYEKATKEAATKRAYQTLFATTITEWTDEQNKADGLGFADAKAADLPQHLLDKKFEESHRQVVDTIAQNAEKKKTSEEATQKRKHKLKKPLLKQSPGHL